MITWATIPRTGWATIPRGLAGDHPENWLGDYPKRTSGRPTRELASANAQRASVQHWSGKRAWTCFGELNSRMGLRRFPAWGAPFGRGTFF